MKKIAILSDKFPPLSGGGIATSNYNLYRLLKEKGYDVKVFTYLDNYEEVKEIKKDSNIYRVGITKLDKRILNINFFFQRKVSIWILREKREKGLSYQYYIFQLSQIGVKKLNKQILKFNPDIVILPDFGVPGYSLKTSKSTKYIHVSHSNPMRYTNNPLIGLHSKLDAEKTRGKEQLTLNKIDAVICPSAYMKEVFKNTYKFNKQIFVIPNIVDKFIIDKVEKKNIHSILKIDNHTPIVYIPSAGSPIKGQKFVVEIMRRISKALKNKIAFYLSGELTKEQLYELNEYEYINYYSPGKVSYNDNIRYIKSCELCISPTLLESFGMALLEALYCSIPCIAFDVGGNKDIVRNNINGFLVQYLDIETLIEKSIQLLKDQNKLKIFQYKINNDISDSNFTQDIVNKYTNLFYSLTK